MGDDVDYGRVINVRVLDALDADRDALSDALDACGLPFQPRGLVVAPGTVRFSRAPRGDTHNLARLAHERVCDVTGVIDALEAAGVVATVNVHGDRTVAIHPELGRRTIRLDDHNAPVVTADEVTAAIRDVRAGDLDALNRLERDTGLDALAHPAFAGRI